MGTHGETYDGVTLFSANSMRPSAEILWPPVTILLTLAMVTGFGIADLKGGN